MSDAPVNALAQALTGQSDVEHAIEVWAAMSPAARTDAYIKARDAWCARFGWSPFHMDAMDQYEKEDFKRKKKIGKSHRDLR